MGQATLRIAEMSSEESAHWETWLREVDRPNQVMSPVFEVDFNLEYWSCQLFGGDNKAPRKLYEIANESGRVRGRLEVGAYAGMNLEPFDRLMMLALLQLWHDQGGDPQGRIAFSYRELFRRLGLKAGGRQNSQIKDSLDRLRRCFITLTNCFMTRTREGEVVPVEAEADPFTILRLKQTATLGTGQEAQRLVVCQLSPVVLTGLREPERLRPRVHSGVLTRLRAKNSTAILLHGYYNGRLRMGEQRHFEYKDLAQELRIEEQFHSNLVNRLLNPHQTLEQVGAIAIAESKSERRGRGLTITLLAPPGDEERVEAIKIEVEPTRVPLEEKDKDQLPLFDEAVVEYDEQLLLAFRAAGVKNIRFLLKRYGRSIGERELWALLENVREKNADAGWEWRRGPDAYVAKCLNDGFYVAEDYQPPKDRFKQVQEQELEKAQKLAQEESARRQWQSQRDIYLKSLSSTQLRELEDEALGRMLDSSQGLRALVKARPEAAAEAPLEERYQGLNNRIVREAFDRSFEQRLRERLAIS